MKIGFVVNDISTELDVYTTTRLAHTAHTMGHEPWHISVGDFAYDPDGTIVARGTSVPGKKYSSASSFMKALQGDKAVTERMAVSDLDVVMLRSDPAEDAVERPWAVQAGVLFCRRAVDQGVVVLNNPEGLAKALNKMYFQDFPEEVRPRTIITRDRADVKAFAKDQGGTIVLKPLQGSGGQSVFLVRPEDAPNLNQMIEAVSRDGYVVAQEYLPGAEKGDTRLFVMNGVPLMCDGKYAAFRRARSGDDMRSNITAGGTVKKAEIGEVAHRIAEIIRPKLVMDGMFMVGLDIVGDKLMEVNVFSPGGLHSAESLEGVDFTKTVIESLECKVRHARNYPGAAHNAVVSML
ncbi:glutathione synthase [soil metagenome]